METIEQLKADNTKLTERLNNAAKFFREQKAQIEALTKENEELKRIPKEEVIDTEKWNALVTEKEDLNKQLSEYELKLQKSEADYKDLKKVYEDEQSEYENKITLLEEDNIKLSEQNHLLEEKIQQNLEVTKSYNDQFLTIDRLTKQNEDLQKQLNECELKLQDSETAYEQLNKKYEARKNQIAELTGNIEVQKNEYENKITSLKDDIKTLNDDVIKQNQEIEKLQIEKSDLEVNINDLTNRLSESVNGKTKYQEFTEMIINLVDSFNNNGNNIDTDKHSSITVNTYKNSTGSQFMADAPGMNI